MTTNDEMVSVSALDKIFSWAFSAKQDEVKPEQKPEQEPPEPQEDYAAQVETLQTENEQFKAKVAAFEAAGKRQERVDHFAAGFEEVEVNHDLYGILADIPEEQAEQLMVIIKAIAEQARVANLTEDVGGAGANIEGDPVAAFDAAVKKVMNDEAISYPKAMDIVKVAQPEVFNAYVEVR